jgi:hypothetical protein
MRRLAAITPLGLLAAAAWAGPFTASPPLQISGPSPLAGCTADDVPGQPGTNYPGSEVEPTVDVNPANSAHLVAGYQQDRWSNGGARGLVASVSFNSGVTWTQVLIPGITLCSGGTAANGGDFHRATDPWISFSPNGVVYFFSLSLDVVPPAGSPGGGGKNAMFVSRSSDGGLTWGAPVKLAEDLNPRFLNDKNTITADPADWHFVYAVWDRLQARVGAVIRPENVFGLGFKGPTIFSRTTDSGASWEPARVIYEPGANSQTIGNQIVVLPDGTLVNAFDEILGFRNSDGGAQFDLNFSLIRSTDKGATWTRGPAIRAAKMEPMAVLRPSSVVDPDSGAAVRTSDIIPEIAVDRSLSSPMHGNLYAVWQDARFSGFTYDDIAFVRSTDGGLTWSAPIKVNQTPSAVPPGNRQAFTPMVKVLPDGTIGVTYYDFRNNTSDPSTLWTDYFIVHCHPSSTVTCTRPADWTSETRLTTLSFDMRRAPTARGYFLGDYMGLAVQGSRFVPVFIQAGPAPGTSDAYATQVGP